MTAKPDLIEQPHGGAILSGGVAGNSGGKKGRSGRKPDWFKQELQELLLTPESLDAVRRVLEDSDHPQFASLWSKVATQAYGYPPRQAESPEPIEYRVVFENAHIPEDEENSG